MHGRVFWRVVLVATCAVLLGSASIAQDSGARITGRVLESGVAPFGGVEVTAVGAATLRVAPTARDGRFEIANLPPGRYTLSMRPFENSERLERTLTVLPSSVQDVDFAFPLDLCRGIVDTLRFDLATSFRRSSGVAHVRILSRTATIPHGGDCGKPAYRYAAEVIEAVKNPSFAESIGRTIAVQSQSTLTPGDEYVVWLRAWSRVTSAVPFTLDADDEMLERVERGRIHSEGGEIPGVSEHPTAGEFLDALGRYLGIDSALPDTAELRRALRFPDLWPRQVTALRFANRRRGEVDSDAIVLMSEELERLADVGRRLSRHPSERHETDAETYGLSLMLVDVLAQQRDPRALPALAPYVSHVPRGALMQFGSAAVPVLVAGMAKSDVADHGMFRVTTMVLLEEMLKTPSIAATLSAEDKRRICSVAHDFMAGPIPLSDASDPESREVGRFVLEAAAHLAIVTGDPGLRREASALVDDEAAFQERHIDPMWIPLISTRIRRALTEIPAPTAPR